MKRAVSEYPTRPFLLSMPAGQDKLTGRNLYTCEMLCFIS